MHVFGSPHSVSYYTGENEGPRHSELGKLLTHQKFLSQIQRYQPSRTVARVKFRRALVGILPLCILKRDEMSV